jgi:hypothetical protein
MNDESGMFKRSDRPGSNQDEHEQLPVQERFARLELQRLEKQLSIEEKDETAVVDDEHEPPERPSIDPSTTSAFLFPGQGTQFVGMG